ncbi:MAG: leucine-rich repeat protein [Muribaculaceae bacterium]|nr:leucine-rich repeat protein [Muribaculaceae bacterium]
MNKILFKFLLLVAIAAAALPAVAYDFMLDGIAYNINSDGESVTVTYEREPDSSNNWISYANASGSLTIPGSVTYNGKTYTVTSIGENAFRGCSGFTGSLTILYSATAIGDDAFYGCTGFTGPLYIPNSVTKIGIQGFGGCTGLTSLNLGNSLTEIGSYAFSTCTSLTGPLNLPESLTKIGRAAFHSCGFTGTLTIPQNIEVIDTAAFYNCKGFTSLNLGNSVTSIGTSAFGCCSGLTGPLNIPNSVTRIGNNAFYGCTGLTGPLTIPNSVTKIGIQGFWGCTGLTSLNLGNSLTEIGSFAFSACTGLTGPLNLPESLTKIGRGAFHSCGFTGTLTIPKNIEVIDTAAFYKCKGFTSLNIGNSLTEIGRSAFSTCTSLTGRLNLPESLTKIGREAFYSCGFTGTLTIPKNVTVVDTAAFYNCKGFTSLNIGNSVTTIGSHAFDGCTGLTGPLNLPELLTNIGDYAFYQCRFTGSLTIPNSVTSIGNYAFGFQNRDIGFTGSLIIGNSVTTIGNYAFCNLNGEGGFTGSLTIPNSVISIGEEAFIGCQGFTSLTIGNSVKSIGRSAFSICTGLTGQLIIPNTVNNIGYAAFNGCAGLTGLTIGNSVTNIGDYAFGGCTGLTGSLTIPVSVINIGDCAFGDCRFTSLTIPESVTSIGEYAFYNCRLNSIYNHINHPSDVSLSNNVFYNVPTNNCILYVTPGRVEEYRAANQWKDFSRILEGDWILTATSLILNKSSLTINQRDSAILVATILPYDASVNTLLWVSSNPSVATVNQNGMVTAVGGGSATIIVSTTDGSFLSAYCTVTVIPGVSNITLNKPNTSIYIGGCETLTATVLPENAFNKTLRWSSSDTTVASVDQNGVITGNRVGSSLITATATDGSGVTGSCQVTVTGVTHIALDNQSMYVTGTATLTPVITPADVLVKTVSWSSSNPTVVSVDQNGVVTANKIGTATITATATDGSGVTGSCQVTVTGITNLRLNKSATSVYVTGTEQLVPTFTPDDVLLKTLTWHTSDPAVATVDQNGLVTTRMLGTVTITATTTDGTNLSDRCVVSVSGISHVQLNKSQTALYVGGGETLTATITPADVLVSELTWTSSDPAVATVDQNGRVTARAEGTATITVTTTDGTNLSATCLVTVVPQYALSAAALTHTRGEDAAVADLAVDMINKEAISNLQFDLRLPQGVTMRKQMGLLYDVTLDDARKTRNHSVNMTQLANGDYRVVVASPQNKELKGNSGTLVHIGVTLEQYHAAGDSLVRLHNITFTEADETEHLVDEATSTVRLCYVLGDADADVRVDAADYTTTALHIMERPTLRFYKDAANVNDRDTIINVTDLTGIVNIALGIRAGEVRYAPRVDGDDDASGSDIALTAQPAGSVMECVLTNDMAVAAMQLDVELPHGVTVERAEVVGRAARHEVTAGTLADGRVRLLVSSFSSRDIAAGDDCVLRLTLAGNQSRGMAHVSSITLVERDLTTHHADDLWVPLGTTALDDLTACNEVRIYALDGAIVIESPVAGTAQLIQMNGIATPLRVEAGRNVYPMDTDGIAIVRFGAKTAKVRF